MIATLVKVLCCCSWRGTLPTRSACPACGVSDHDRVTRERLQKLREIRERPDAWIAPIMRRRLIEMKLITCGGPRPPREAAPRRPKNRKHWLTAAGTRVLEVADPEGRDVSTAEDGLHRVRIAPVAVPGSS